MLEFLRAFKYRTYSHPREFERRAVRPSTHATRSILDGFECVPHMYRRKNASGLETGTSVARFVLVDLSGVAGACVGRVLVDFVDFCGPAYWM